VLEVALEEEEEEEELFDVVEVSVSVGPTLSDSPAPERVGPPLGTEPVVASADGSGAPKPTAVRPPPASADSAARRAQRRRALIGVLRRSRPLLDIYRRAAHSPLTLSVALASR
jgi:hypothetical protein